MSGGKFKPGESGNPKGRPKGRLNKTTLAMQDLFNGEAEAISRKAIDLAMAGDAAMIRLCVDRIFPAPKDSPVNFELPALNNFDDAKNAMRSILQQVADGHLTPIQASEISKILNVYVESELGCDLERRIREVEEGKAK